MTDTLKKAAKEADFLCCVCGDYVTQPDDADTDSENRFGHIDCLQVLNE